MMMFDQVGAETFDWFRSKGARYAVAVRQQEMGNSEDWAVKVSRHVQSEHGLHACIPGGDSWDNPPMCVALFNDKRAAERCVTYFNRCELREL